MKTVEINGIKLEIDERTARTVEQYRVGDRVKVLVKEYQSYRVFPGVIVGFAAFVELPTIEVMYLSSDAWDKDPLKFVSINAKSEGVEIAPINEAEVVLDREDTLERIDRAIRESRNRTGDLERKRDFFVEKFAAAFGAEQEVS